MAKTLFISVVIFSKLIVNSILSDNSPSAGQPCKTIKETIADKEGCETYFICNNDNKWSRRSCCFPLLFSETEKLCQDFINVSCGERREPKSPCMYTGESEARCSYIPQHTICQCVNTTDLNFDMCINLSDGFYTWPSRKLSKYYIQCLVGRTLPTECEGSSMVFDHQERHCSLVYDEVSRVYNHTVPLPEFVLVPVPSMDVDVTRTRFVLERSVSLQQPSSAFDFDSLTSSAGENSIGKQSFLPSFSQLIYAALTDGDVKQTNLVPDRSLLFQQTSSVCVTNTLKSKFEKSLTVLQSSMALSLSAINVDMTQTQFVPEKYTLLQPMDSTISFKPSTLAFDAFKSTFEIYSIDVEPLSGYIQNPLTTKYVPASTVQTLFPVSNTLISQSSFFRIAYMSTSIDMQNLYSSDRVRTTPNRMTKALTSTTTVTISLDNSSEKHYWCHDSSTWIVDGENSADFSSWEAINIPLSDQNLYSISSEFSEMSVINYGTYLSAGSISKSDIIFQSDYVRNSNVIKTFFFEHQSTSYPSSNFPELANKMYHLSKNLSNTVLDRSLYQVETKQVQYLTMSEPTQGNFDITTYEGPQLSYTSRNDSPPPAAAKKSTDFTITYPSVMSDNNFILSTRAFLTISETDLDRLSLRSQSQMHIFSPEANANKEISRQNNLSLFMPSDLTDIGTAFPASKAGSQHGLSNVIFIPPSDTEIKVSKHFKSNHLSQLPKTNTQDIISISIFASTIITSFKIFTSPLNTLLSAILESTVPTTDGQSSIIRDVPHNIFSVLPAKATSDERMQSNMAPSFHSKIMYGEISSLEQFGYSALESSPKLEYPKTTFSTMDSIAQSISTIIDSIKPTKAKPASKSAPLTVSMKPTEVLKSKLTTVESKIESSDPSIFPSKLILSRSSSTPPMLKISKLMASELILKSAFVPVTPMNFQMFLQQSGTTAMGAYSLLRIFESFHSTKSLHYSSLQTITFEAGEPSSEPALKSSPGSMPLTYDSQLSPSRMLEIASPSQTISRSATLIISTSNLLVKIIKANASSLTSLTDMISSSVPDKSNSQSTESKEPKQNDNRTKSITSAKNQESNSFNLTNTSLIAVLVGSSAGFVVFVMLTTILIIRLRKRTKRKQ